MPNENFMPLPGSGQFLEDLNRSFRFGGVPMPVAPLPQYDPGLVSGAPIPAGFVPPDPYPAPAQPWDINPLAPAPVDIPLPGPYPAYSAGPPPMSAPPLAAAVPAAPAAAAGGPPLPPSAAGGRVDVPATLPELAMPIPEGPPVSPYAGIEAPGAFAPGAGFEFDPRAALAMALIQGGAGVLSGENLQQGLARGGAAFGGAMASERDQQMAEYQMAERARREGYEDEWNQYSAALKRRDMELDRLDKEEEKVIEAEARTRERAQEQAAYDAILIANGQSEEELATQSPEERMRGAMAIQAAKEAGWELVQNAPGFKSRIDEKGQLVVEPIPEILAARMAEREAGKGKDPMTVMRQFNMDRRNLENDLQRDFDLIALRRDRDKIQQEYDEAQDFRKTRMEAALEAANKRYEDAVTGFNNAYGTGLLALQQQYGYAPRPTVTGEEAPAPGPGKTADDIEWPEP